MSGRRANHRSNPELGSYCVEWVPGCGSATRGRYARSAPAPRTSKASVFENVHKMSTRSASWPVLVLSVRSALLNRLKRWECLMSRTIALLVAIVVCGGCERESRIPSLDTPSPTAPSQSASRPVLASAQIEGRVIEADFENPIPGAHITTDWSCYQDRCGPGNQPYSTVADEHGYFRLTANLPQDWSDLTLKVAHPGFEPAEFSLKPESARFAVLKAYRTITIRPGESVQLRVLHFQETCAEESIACRRIMVEAPGDELINLEVVPVQSEDAFGVLVAPFPYSLPPLQTRLTVRRGAAWIVRTPAFMSGTGMVTVVARR
jgi:hypothetical protein